MLIAASLFFFFFFNEDHFLASNELGNWPQILTRSLRDKTKPSRRHATVAQGHLKAGVSHSWAQGARVNRTLCITPILRKGNLM